MNPQLSVVIPVYNNAQSALRTVESVLNQTEPAGEIILVDDCSLAENVESLEALIAPLNKDVPIEILRLTKNGGPALARHAGAQRAKGTHVAFLDADDLWHQQKIAAACKAIIETGADLLGHNRPWATDISAQTLKQPLKAITWRKLRLLHFLMRNPIPTSSIVVRTDIAKTMFRHGGRRSEDYMALVLAQKEAEITAYADVPLCWAAKPPFGTSGEGADQVAIYRESFRNMWKLTKTGAISNSEFAIFAVFFCIRVPIGFFRFKIYQRQYGYQKTNG